MGGGNSVREKNAFVCEVASKCYKSLHPNRERGGGAGNGRGELSTRKECICLLGSKCTNENE